MAISGGTGGDQPSEDPDGQQWCLGRLLDPPYYICFLRHQLQQKILLNIWSTYCGSAVLIIGTDYNLGWMLIKLHTLYTNLHIVEKEDIYALLVLREAGLANVTSTTAYTATNAVIATTYATDALNSHFQQVQRIAVYVPRLVPLHLLLLVQPVATALQSSLPPPISILAF